MQISLELDGDVQLNRRLLRIGKNAEDPRPALRHIAEFWMVLERAQFETGGQAGSGGWEPLSDATIQSKQAHGAKQPDAPLIDTGDLMRSLSEPGGHQILEIGHDLMLFGTDLDYARFHQHGTSRMPRRRPLELTERHRVESARKLQAWLFAGKLT